MHLGRAITIFLILSIFNMPYGYYTLLRLIVTVGSVAYCVQFLEKKNMNMVYLFGFIAILFNPLIPVYLNKETWLIIDLIVGGIFFFIRPDQDD
jgi:hypothetical protein